MYRICPDIVTTTGCKKLNCLFIHCPSEYLTKFSYYFENNDQDQNQKIDNNIRDVFRNLLREKFAKMKKKKIFNIQNLTTFEKWLEARNILRQNNIVNNPPNIENKINLNLNLTQDRLNELKIKKWFQQMENYFNNLQPADQIISREIIGSGTYGEVLKCTINDNNNHNNSIEKIETDKNSTLIFAEKISIDEDENTIHREYYVRSLLGPSIFPGLITFYNYSREYDKIIMRYYSHSLRDLIDLWSRSNRIRYMPEILYQLIQGLDKIHGFGYLHSDIKPRNIFINFNPQLFAQLLSKQNRDNDIKQEKLTFELKIELSNTGNNNDGDAIIPQKRKRKRDKKKINKNVINIIDNKETKEFENPENLEIEAVLGDLGSTSVRSWQSYGTLSYQSPEIKLYDSYDSTRNDIYSLGLSMIEFVEGNRNNFDQYIKHIDKIPLDFPLRKLIKSMIHHQSSKRPFAFEVLNLLKKFLK